MKNDLIHSVIVCDDIRQEISGKEILIGVYKHNVGVPNLPGLLPSIGIRIEFEPKSHKIIYEMQVRDPQDVVLFSSEGGVPEKQKIVAISIVHGPVPLRSEGTYKVYFGQKNDLKCVYELEVEIKTNINN